MKSVSVIIIDNFKKTFRFKSFDIRTILFICFVITFFAVVCRQIDQLLIVLSFTLCVNLFFRVKLFSSSLRKLLIAVFVISAFQSLFFRTGDALIVFLGIKILSYQGFQYAFKLMIRTYILLLTSILIISSDRSKLTAGLAKMKIPFEIIFMIQLAVRFFPIFAEEFKNTVYVMQLRGVDFKKIYSFSTVKSFFKIIIPVTVNALLKAENLAVTAETRGFRYKNERTYYKETEMQAHDWMCIVFVSVLAFVFCIYIFTLRG